MKFELSEDQEALRQTVADLLAKQCTPAEVRAAWQSPPGELDRGVWSQLEAMGVLSVLMPESLGGLGLDACALVPILQETGRVALPHPIVETALVFAPLGLTGLVATNLGSSIVSCAADADVLALRAGDSLRMYQPDEAEIVPVATVDGGRRGATVSPTGDGSLITDDPAEVTSAQWRGALGAAAQLVGLSQRMLEVSVAYVTQRHQFGVPIGSFQAVKHHLATALVHIEFAGPAVLRAAHSIAVAAPTVDRDVSMAKALATDAAMITSRAALQCHGAIGYTVEYDLHLFMKRAWALARCWGDRDFHAGVVAKSLEEVSSQ